MQTEGSQEIIKRFFEVIYALKEQKVIRGKQTFTAKYGINRWNLNTLEKNHSSDIFQVEWLVHLVNDYEASAQWLITGKGQMFITKKK
jgi:hypothetical protein